MVTGNRSCRAHERTQVDSPLNAGDDGVGVGALLGALVTLLKDNDLLAGLSSRENDGDLCVCQLRSSVLRSWDSSLQDDESSRRACRSVILQLCPVLQLLIHTSGLVDLDHCWQESIVSAADASKKVDSKFRFVWFKRVSRFKQGESTTRENERQQHAQRSRFPAATPIPTRPSPDRSTTSSSFHSSRHQTFVHFHTVQSFLPSYPVFRLVHCSSIIVGGPGSFPSSSSSVRMLVAVRLTLFSCCRAVEG